MKVVISSNSIKQLQLTPLCNNTHWTVSSLLLDTAMELELFNFFYYVTDIVFVDNMLCSL